MKPGPTQRILVACTLAAVAFALLAVPAYAEKAELPRHTESYSWSSGLVSGKAAGDLTRKRAGHELAAAELIFVPDAQWLRIIFSSARLGEESYVELTSLSDGATQRLDARTLREWSYSSAFFNGDAVEVKLFVGPTDRDVFVDVADVVVGDWPESTKSICGTDDRVASSEPRVGRLVPIGCTGWIVDNGKYVTAGHCLDSSSAQIFEFNVPLSQSDGTIVHPGPEDQYAMIQSSFDFVNGGVGNDWGIFAVSDNPGTGLQPIDAQGASFSVAQDLGPANIRITGFGVDSGSANQTNQTHVGPNAGSSGTTMRYATDTTGGNSGSPVIDNNSSRSVGVHTHGGCTSSGGNNSGTSLFHTGFWDALTGQTPSCAPKGASCVVDSDCCSNKCRGKAGAKTCK